MSGARERAVVFGVANKWSIAYGTVMAMLAEGIEVICPTAPALADKARRALNNPAITVLPCDVEGRDDDIIAVANHVREVWPDGFDYLVHAIAFSDKKELEGSILDITRENLLRSVDISAYSFKALCQHLGPQMRDGGAAACFTFAGSRKVSPNYNTMGVAKGALEVLTRYLAAEFGKRRIRVNAISAGPIKTLSSSAIGDFNLSLAMGAIRSATGENVSAEEVGVATLNILRSPGITGAVIQVDNGIEDLVGTGSSDAEMEIHRAHKERT